MNYPNYHQPMLTKSFLLIASCFFLFSCQNTQRNEGDATTANASTQLQFADYPNLKLGFTTQNFLQVMPVNLENSKKLVDYAAEQGYAWIELRDPDAVLSVDESHQIADYASEKSIEVSYAIQKGLLDDDFWPTFERGVNNAAVFGKPGIFRSLGSFAEFTADPEKQGWTAEELEQLVQYADSAAAMADSKGLQYVIENAAESFFTNTGEYYGIADVFARSSSQVGWQFDTANPFSVSRVHPPADSVGTYLAEHADNLYYIHLKSAKNGQAQPVLMENPLPFEEVFKVMAEHDVPYVAIELQAVADEAEAFRNMEQSIVYLREQGFLVP